MAYVSKPKDEETPEQPALAAMGAPGGGAAPIVGAAAPTRAPTPSGGFVNPSLYAVLNADAGKAMAQRVAGSVAEKGKGVQDDVTKAQMGYQVARDAGATTAGSLSEQDPTGYQGLQERAEKVGGEARALGSQEGLEALLQQQNAGTPYSAGAARLDAFLMGAGGGADLRATAGQYGGLAGILGAANTQSGQYQPTGPRVTPYIPPAAQPQSPFQAGGDVRELYRDTRRRKRPGDNMPGPLSGILGGG